MNKEECKKYDLPPYLADEDDKKNSNSDKGGCAKFIIVFVILFAIGLGLIYIFRHELSDFYDAVLSGMITIGFAFAVAVGVANAKKD